MLATPPDRSGPRPTVGLALGGGGVRGAAHFGVIGVLEGAGVPIDLITGTSIGAMVGAGYAAGVSVQEMSRRVRRMTRQDFAGLPKWGGLSLFDTLPLQRWFARTVHPDVRFEDLSIPLSCVACDVTDGSQVVLDHGPVGMAAMASAAIPGLFSPVELDGRLLVDGGLVNNLPVDIARSMGADVVVAVDLMPSWKKRPRPTSAREVIGASVTIAAGNTEAAARADADFLLTPEIDVGASAGLAVVPEAEEAGRRAARAIAEKLLRATTA